MKVPHVTKDNQYRYKLLRESFYARTFLHDRIAQYYGHTKTPGESSRLGIVTKYYPHGSLQDFLASDIGSKLLNSERIYLAIDILHGIMVLFDRDCFHQDIALRNILVAREEDKFRAKLCDFGFTEYKEIPPGTNVPARNMAPEVLSRETVATRQSELFSIGCTFFELFSGTKVFADKTAKEIQAKPTDRCLDEDELEKMPDVVADLIETLVKFKPEERGTIEEALARLKISLKYVLEEEAKQAAAAKAKESGSNVIAKNIRAIDSNLSIGSTTAIGPGASQIFNNRQNVYADGVSADNSNIKIGTSESYTSTNYHGNATVFNGTTFADGADFSTNKTIKFAN
eukprot:TRINITY_DN22043_c0_g1_i1.p1 TRINITY_DN22043_c0_g1~~TRINITY_DN22043_c0_g1_i1.p1  ORF type:complete len:384 (-),score=65.22 TRINITY_DN22043_c0_g1_i1:67-1095(-)